MLDGAIYLRSRNLWGVILMHTLTDVSAFLAVFESNATGMDIIFCVFGSLLFIALAFYLIRPAKRAEIDELWAEGWSFGDEDGKKRIGAKVAAILTAVLVVTFAASLGVTIYQAKMGYDIPFFPTSEMHSIKMCSIRSAETEKNSPFRFLMNSAENTTWKTPIRNHLF